MTTRRSTTASSGGLGLLLLLGLCGSACGGGPEKLTLNYYYLPADCGQFEQCSIRPSTIGLPADKAATFQLVSGILPRGMSLDPSTGELRGAPSTLGDTYGAIDLSVAGFQGTLHSGANVRVVPIQLSYAWTTDPLAITHVGNTVTLVPMYPRKYLTWGELLDPGVTTAYSVTLGALPPGVALDPTTGAISGAPSASRSYSARIAAHLEYMGQSLDMTDDVSLTVLK
jgi:hypothetical protein